MQVIRDYIALAIFLRRVVPFLNSNFSFEEQTSTRRDDPEYDKKRSDWMFDKICQSYSSRRTPPSLREVQVRDEVYDMFDKIARTICEHAPADEAHKPTVISTMARIFIEVQLEGAVAYERHRDSMQSQSHLVRARFNSITIDARFNWSNTHDGFDTPDEYFKPGRDILRDIEKCYREMRDINQERMDDEEDARRRAAEAAIRRQEYDETLRLSRVAEEEVRRRNLAAQEAEAEARRLAREAEDRRRALEEASLRSQQNPSRRQDENTSRRQDENTSRPSYMDSSYCTYQDTTRCPFNDASRHRCGHYDREAERVRRDVEEQIRALRISEAEQIRRIYGR
jgi:hypothetical protein